jgi:acyl-CoA synthetase (AMP-forming)/AMP-acid ligase II
MLRRASGFPRGIRFVDRSEQDTFFPYEEIFRRAARLAGGLRALGINRGDRVAVILPTSIDFLDAFYGTTLAGAVPVPLYPPIRLGRLDEYHARTAGMLTSSGARLLITDKRIRRLLGKTLRQTSKELSAIVLENVPQISSEPAVSSPDDLALIQFSSGTQDSPKPIRLTHRHIIANIDSIRGAILRAYPEGTDLTHVGASWLPLYHDMGLVGSILTALAHPSDQILIPPEVFVSRPFIWLRTISRFRATVTAAPNFAYSLCADRVPDEEVEDVDLSSLRVAFNGAEPVTSSALVRFVERFRPFGLREEALTPVYGLAEAALAVSFSDLSRRFRIIAFDRDRLAKEGTAQTHTHGLNLVSVGKPLAGYSIQVADERGLPLPEDRVGRVLVRGPSIMEGYHGRPELTAEVRRGEWLDTGDTGFTHEGELFLYGRRKELITIRGRSYAPNDIEQSLEGVEGLRRGCWAAAGIVHEGADGESLVIFVERDRTRNPDEDTELARAVSARVMESSGFKPHQVLVLEPGTLPRTSSGKIRRGEARNRFLDGTLQPPKPVNLFSVAGEIVRSKFASFGEKNEL